jgi:STE24 endopeptidase
MSSFSLTLLFVSALLASSVVKFWLAHRQMRHVATHRNTVPAAFSQTITLSAHQKAAYYTLAKARFCQFSMAFGADVLV